MGVPGAEMNEAEFVAEVLRETDCGLLLDVTNPQINAANHRYEVDDFLARIPLERVVQLHFVGGHRHGQVWIDSHSRPTPDDVWTVMDGQKFDACFRAYAEGYLPDGTHNHHDDATAFAQYLKKNRPPDTPDDADEVLRYETTWLLARQPKRFLRIRRFRYALKPILRSLSTPYAEPQAVTCPIACDSLAIWVRLAPAARLHHLLWR
jgi:hypothetical protein